MRKRLRGQEGKDSEERIVRKRCRGQEGLRTTSIADAEGEGG